MNKNQKQIVKFVVFVSVVFFATYAHVNLDSAIIVLFGLLSALVWEVFTATFHVLLLCPLSENE